MASFSFSVCARQERSERELVCVYVCARVWRGLYGGGCVSQLACSSRPRALARISLGLWTLETRGGRRIIVIHICSKSTGGRSQKKASFHKGRDWTRCSSFRTSTAAEYSEGRQETRKSFLIERP